MKLDDATERDIIERVERFIAKPIKNWPNAVYGHITPDSLLEIQREAIDAYRQSLVAKVEALRPIPPSDDIMEDDYSLQAAVYSGAARLHLDILTIMGWKP